MTSATAACSLWFTRRMAAISTPPPIARQMGERAMVAPDSPPFCKSFFCKPLEIFRGDF